jgi:hypothetical protein
MKEWLKPVDIGIRDFVLGRLWNSALTDFEQFIQSTFIEDERQDDENRLHRDWIHLHLFHRGTQAIKGTKTF